MILGCLHLNAAVFSQNINISGRNVSLETVFSKIEKQTGYMFFSKVELIREMPKVNVNFKNLPLRDALEELLGKLSLSYTIFDKNIVIKPLYTGSGEKPGAPTVLIGKVVDEWDNPMPGVSIRLKGTSLVVVTNREGQFVTAPIVDPEAVLQISYVGYETQEFKVSVLKNPVIVRLKQTISDLDQVQVMAYTTTTKRLNTSNTVTITAEEIAKHPVQNVLEILKDRVPGLYIQQNTGVAGGSYDVTIRGSSTFRGGAPLYIIDGVAFPADKTLPLASRNANGTNASNQFLGGNALNYLNPADVESIDVLKDADATAIYGSRGAFGVILITTKKGRAGKSRLNVNTNTGFVTRGSFPKLLNLEQYLMIRREALANDGVSPGAGDLDLNGTWPTDRFTDWQKELMGSAGLSNTVNASYSGGTGNTNFLIAGTYNRQGSIDKGKGSVRSGSGRFDINTTSPNSKFYIDLSGSYGTNLNDVVPIEFSLSANNLTAPNAPPFTLPDGSLNWTDYAASHPLFQAASGNPLAALNLTYKNTTNNLTANTELRYKPIKGLTLTTRFGYNLLSTNEFSATPSTYFNPNTNSATSTTSYVNNFSVGTINADPNARYEFAFGKKGVLSATVGATLQDQVTLVNNVRGTNFTNDALLLNPATAVTVVSGYNRTVTRYMGVFSVINYNWDNKYILNLNGRVDGSTKFTPGNRNGTFGSVGATWLVSEEPWFKNNISFVSFAKIISSFGVLGGDGIENYLYLDRYTAQSTPYQGKPVLLTAGSSNPDLRWEKKTSFDLALNLEFFKGRISVLANYFRNVSTDLLTLQPLASTTGNQNYLENTSAKIENKGYEFSFNTRNFQGKNFSWTTNFQISLYRNKLLSYPNVDRIAANFSVIEGKTVNGIKLLNYVGVDPKTGYYFYKTPAGVVGQNTFALSPNSVSDRTEFVDLQPRFFGSISNSLTYKSFTVGFTFTGRKRMGLNFMGQQASTPGFFNLNSGISALKRWQKEGDITTVPRATANPLNNLFAQSLFKYSTGAYEMITYARLQNLSLNYSFNPEVLKKAGISVLSIFLRGENLLTISKYGDMDPENLNVGATPQMSTFTAGFNVTF